MEQDPAVRRVSALLDDKRTEQLASTFEKVTYREREYSSLPTRRRPENPALLCKPCQKFWCEPPLPYPGAPSPSHNDQAIPFHYWQRHHESLFQLIDCCHGSAPTFCEVCVLFWWRLRRSLANQRTRRELGNTRPVPARKDLLPFHDCFTDFRLCYHPWSPETLVGYVLANVPVDSEEDGNAANAWLRLDMVPGSSSRTPSSPLRGTVAEILLTLKGIHPASDSYDYIGRRWHRLSEETDSTDTMDQIRDWLEVCQLQHESICNPTSFKLDVKDRPTRLMHYNAHNGLIRLVDTTESPNHPQYVALSYRWGPVLPTTSMLTSKTDNRLRAGIPLDNLPRTIQDAFLVTLRLGFSQLWVDRLCIYQDSAEDWHREAGKMGLVYKYAQLTIAAACARNEDEGIFRYRGPGGGGHRPVYLPFPKSFLSQDCRGSNRHRKWCLVASYPQKWMSCIPAVSPQGYLEKRGWIFQESMLSPRIVRFAGDQIHWECYHSMVNESRPLEQPYRTPLKGRLLPSGYADGPSINAGWERIVEMYSETNLTFLNDRLSALSAMARAFAKSAEKPAGTIHPWEKVERVYHAGLWSNTFHQNLLWVAFQSPAILSRNTIISDWPPPTKDYIAPSWSWARCQGPIRYPRHRRSESAWANVAIVEDIQLQHVGEDKFGAVKGGWVQIRGHLSRVCIVRNRPAKDSPGIYKLADHNVFPSAISSCIYSDEWIMKETKGEEDSDSDSIWLFASRLG